MHISGIDTWTKTMVAIKHISETPGQKYKNTKIQNTQMHISGMDTWTKTMVAIKVLTAFKKRRKKKKEAEVHLPMPSLQNLSLINFLKYSGEGEDCKGEKEKSVEKTRL